MAVKQINAGKRNRRITIERRNPNKPYTKDEEGRQIENYESYITTWAYVKNVNGKEFFQASRTNAEKTARFNIRYVGKPIDTSMRVIYEGNIYNILYIDDIEEAHMQIELMCERLK